MTDPAATLRLTRQQALRLGLAAAAALALPARAQEHDHGASAGAAAGTSTEGYLAAAERMHVAMDIDYTGNADIDFARGMIGHHQGAIDMARVMLEHGEDPELLMLAREVITAQEREIAFLESWLAVNGG